MSLQSLRDLLFRFFTFRSYAPDKMADLIFSERNISYGAYPLRKQYNRRMSLALLLSIVLFISMLLLYSIEWGQEENPEYYMTEVHMDAPPEFKLPGTAPKSPVQKKQQQEKEPVQSKRKDDLKIVQDKEVVEQSVNKQVTDEKSEQKDSVGSQGLPGSQSSDLESGIAVDFADVMPQFPGGQVALLRFIQSKLLYPQEAMRLQIEGVVLIGFVVDKYGRVRNPKVLKSLTSSCDAEALRVVRLIPDWIPAKNEGRNVSVQFSLPVEFKLRRTGAF